jgi:hypothetical protein
MTVIAWDGKTLAADKQATTSGLMRKVTKIRRINGRLFAVSGDWDRGQLMFDWAEQGMKREDWPEFQKKDDEWVGMVMIDEQGKAWKFERAPIPYLIEDPTFAMGSGRDYAYAAMHMGADAANAVLVACAFESGCGLGVDVMRIEEAKP